MPELKADDFSRKKKKGECIAILTAYDYFAAHLIEKAGLDAILVGDSLAMVALGYENTLPVTMDEMIHHTKAVRRGAPGMFLIGDIPDAACQAGARGIVDAAERFLDEGGTNAVKVEGAEGERLEAIRRMRKKGIAVMGHLGLLPQILSREGKKLKVQGTDPSSARQILKESHALSELGVFSLVLECVPAGLAERITKEVDPATIGIGAGAGCDGQILVTDDLLGRYDRIRPRFVKRYMDSAKLTHAALLKFKQEVKEGVFPAKEHAYSATT